MKAVSSISLGMPGHEAFQDPDRQGHVEQAVGQGHGDVGVDQPEGRVELEKGQQEDRRRGHAVGQQPEEQTCLSPMKRKREKA